MPAVKNVDAEQQKYEPGTITAFELPYPPTQLAASGQAVPEAHGAYQQAFVAFPIRPVSSN